MGGCGVSAHPSAAISGIAAGAPVPLVGSVGIGGRVVDWGIEMFGLGCGFLLNLLAMALKTEAVALA
jgi:hypothetical protein